MSQDSLIERLGRGFISYLTRVGDAISQLLNVLVLFGDNANESISGRSHRLKSRFRSWAWLNAFIDVVFGKDHCELAYLNDINRAKKTISESAQ